MTFNAEDQAITALLATLTGFPTNVVLTATEHMTTISSSAQLLARAQYITRASTLVIFSPEPAAAKGSQLQYSVGGDVKPLNYISTYKVTSNSQTHNYRWIAHVEGHSAGVAVARLPGMRNPGPAKYPNARFEQLTPDQMGLNFGLEIQEESHFIYEIDADNLRSFIQDTHISMPSKVISWLYYLFPFARGHLAGAFAHNTVNYQAPEALSVDDYMATSAMLCLGPFYSQDTTWAQQVKRRLEAAQARGGYSVPDLVAFTNLARHIPISDRKGFSHVDKAMGLVICQQQGGDPDPMAQDSTLANIAQLFLGNKPDPFTSTLYEQMRLVAQGHRQKTLAFGKAIYAAGAVIIPAIGAAFKDDMDRLAAAMTATNGCSYTGLQDPLPANLQIASFPRAALIGVEYHRRHLPTQAQQQQFGQYITSSIVAHITPSSDVAACVHLAELLTPPSIASMVAILTAMDDDEASHFIAGRPAAEVDNIYKESGKCGSPCRWYVAERDRREAVVLGKMADSVISPLTNLLIRKAGDMRAQPPPATLAPGVDWVSSVRAWENDLLDKIQALRPGSSGISVLAVPGFSDLKAQMELEVAAIIDGITKSAP